jgi:hypothetical protein
MKKLLFAMTGLCAGFALLFSSCSKPEEDTSSSTDLKPGKSMLSIRMTDAPGNFNAVYVDVQGVEIKGPQIGTLNLPVNAGIYNLLDFVNGADTLIAGGPVPAGKIEQVRVILGPNNSVVVDSVTYPLSTPSAQQSGLKLQVHRDFAAGVAYTVLLDFDAQQSIVETGNGRYILKPVIRVVDQAVSGAISGSVVPDSVQCTISATDGTNLFGSFTDSTGGFIIPAVPAGTYTVIVSAPAPWTGDTIPNVTVTNGQVTSVGVVNL